MSKRPPPLLLTEADVIARLRQARTVLMPPAQGYTIEDTCDLHLAGMMGGIIGMIDSALERAARDARDRAGRTRPPA
jgi:hypothetical protein